MVIEEKIRIHRDATTDQCMQVLICVREAIRDFVLGNHCATRGRGTSDYGVLSAAMLAGFIAQYKGFGATWTFAAAPAASFAANVSYWRCPSTHAVPKQLPRAPCLSFLDNPSPGLRGQLLRAIGSADGIK